MRTNLDLNSGVRGVATKKLCVDLEKHFLRVTDSILLFQGFLSGRRPCGDSIPVPTRFGLWGFELSYRHRSTSSRELSKLLLILVAE